VRQVFSHPVAFASSDANQPVMTDENHETSGFISQPSNDIGSGKRHRQRKVL